MKYNFQPKWFIVGTFFLVGLFFGGVAVYTWLFNGGGQRAVVQRANDSSYHFINPIISVNSTDNKQFLPNVLLTKKLEVAAANPAIATKPLAYSVYFRDLLAGNWVGINEDSLFSPGNLPKVPLMVAYFKSAEDNTSLLSSQVTYTGSPALGTSNYSTIIPGQQYATEDLLKEMVLRDDGNTASLLFDNIDQPSLNDVFSDLGIDFTESKNGVGYLSIKQYALVFRVLYNSTYLNRDLSEEALSILSNTKSSNGVAAGIDPNLSVAHLYELTQVASTGAGSATADKTKPATYEAYDCGIVYYPGHPYEMCATVTTTNAASIPVMFQSLNKAAYENMQDTYPTQN